MTTKPKASEVNQSVIEGWKSQYDQVMKYVAGDGKVAYFKNPDMASLDAASAIANTNPIKSNLILAKACFIGGDEEIISQDKYILGLSNHLKSMIVKIEGELSTL
ncbi:MAG TPA: hypothetical protein VD794_12875 [Flavisolibacter sp.]|nr:hypothetical protein [Flavisolibacter sp.]